MDKNFFHNHFIYKHRKGIALLLLIGFLGSPLGGVLPARAAETAAAGDTQSKGILQGLILDPMKTFFSGLASFNYGDFLKLIIKDSLNTVVDRFYSQVVKSFEDEYLVQDYNRQVFVPYLDFGFAKFHNWVASEVGDAKIDAPLLNAFLGLENLAYRGLKETGNKLSHSVLKELDKVSNEMSGEDRPPSISDHDYWGKSFARLWTTPQGLFWGAVGTTMDVAASSEAEGNRDYIISEGHNDGRKVTDMPEAIESYFLKKGDILPASAPTAQNPLPFPTALGNKLRGWEYTQILSPASGAVSGYSLASKGTYYIKDQPLGLEIWSWDADFPFFLLLSKDINNVNNYVIDGMRTLVKPNVWQEPVEVYPASVAFTSRAISNPLASGWTGLIKRPGQKVKVMVNDLIESKLKIAGDATDLSGVSRIMYDLGKTYLTNVNFKVKRAPPGSALAGCPVGFEVIEPDLGTTMGKMGEPTRPSAGQCLIAALKQVDTNFLGEIVGWVSDLGKKLICWIFDVGDKKGERLTKEGSGVDTQNYTMVPNKDETVGNPWPEELRKQVSALDLESLEALNKTREEAAKTDPNGYTPLLIKNDQGEFQAQASSVNEKQSLLSVSTLAQYIVYKELIEPLLTKSVAEAGKKGVSLLGRAAKWLLIRAGDTVGLGGVVEEVTDAVGNWASESGVTDLFGDLTNFYAFKSGVRKGLELLGFCNLKPEENQIKTETINLSAEGRYDFLEFPYRLTEKSNVTVEIYLRPTDTANENIKLYRKLVFNDMPAGVHIARWDLSTDLSDAESNQIWNEITKSVYINVVFKKEVNGALEFFQGYELPTVTRKQFLSGEKYKPDPTTAAINCHTETYFTPSITPTCGSGYLAQNYMLELPQDPPANQNLNILQRPFAPTPIFYEGQEVPITMRYNNDSPIPADNVHVTLYDLAGVEGGVNNFFGSANFYTGDLVNEAGSEIASVKAKKVYENLIQIPVNCPGYHSADHPSCDIATVTWTAVEPGAHALMMVFDSDKDATNKDQNKLNNRIIQIANVSASPVTAEYEISDGLKTADLRGDGDHPDGDDTGVANPGEEIEIGITLKDIRPLHSGSLSGLDLFIDLENSSVFQYVGSGKNDSGDNKSSIKIGMIVSGQTLILNKDFNLRVKDDAKFGVAKVPLYLRDQYGRIVFHQDLTVPVFPRCSDGKDNDKDGYTDFPADVWGCQNSTDNSEDDGNILNKPDLVPTGLDFQIDTSPAGTTGVVQGSKLDLKFKIKNQGDRAIPKGTVIPMGVYVCYGKPTTETHHMTWNWSWKRGNYCGTPATDPILSVDECYCESKSPASSGALETYAKYFENPDETNQPGANAADDSYKNYIDCIKKKYQRVTETPWTLADEFDFYDEKRSSTGIAEFIIPNFEVREAKNMRFAVFADEKVDANFTEKEGVIPEFNERNNKAGLPDYFCEAGQDTAYLTLYNKDQCNSFPQATYEPARYLSMCMNSFYNATDYKIVVGDKGDWYKPPTGTPSPSPFQYQYTCPSADKCSSLHASCVASTADDWRVNPGEYVLLTINLTNTATKDVKSTFTLTDGPGTKTGINLTTPELVSYAGESTQLFFYVTVPMNDTAGHPYNNNDTLTFTLKGKEADNSPNKPGTEFIIAANLPVKLGTLPAQCPDKPKEPPEPPTTINLKMNDATLDRNFIFGTGNTILKPKFQIKNESSVTVEDIVYHYWLNYFKDEPTGSPDDVTGCYSGGEIVMPGNGIIASMKSISYAEPVTDFYAVRQDGKGYGSYQTYAQVDEKLGGDPNDNVKCSGLEEIRKPDVAVTKVNLSIVQAASKYYLNGSFTIKNNGSETVPKGQILYTWTLFDQWGNQINAIPDPASIKDLKKDEEVSVPLGNLYEIYGLDGSTYSLEIKIEVDEVYDKEGSNNTLSAKVKAATVQGWSKVGDNLQPGSLTLTQRIKRVLNYVRAKFGD
ncbi:MAG: hypothetical protein WC650_06010 [Candidatus Doudnabacteria bacterium]